MNQFLGLNLKLTLNDSTLLHGTVHAINDRTQELSLKAVKLMNGEKVIGSFPELTVNAQEIKDVEIITSANAKSTSKSANKPNKSPNSHSQNNNKTHSNAPANVAKTFPTGNIRHSLPAEDFDFAASLARFDKARIFSEIAQNDCVRPEDRLVSINSPQRKLGINEDVLEGEEAKNSIIRAQERKAQIASAKAKELPIEKLLGMSIGQPKRSVLIVEDSESEMEAVDGESHASSAVETYGIPQGKENAQLSADEMLYSSLCFAQHLLPSLLAAPSSPAVILALLGVEEESQFALQLLLHLTKHSRLPASCQIFACFAVGGTGQRIELPVALKSMKSQLLGRVTFLSSLAEVCSKVSGIEKVLVLDALRDRTGAILSGKTVQTLTALLQGLLKHEGTRLLGLNGTILRGTGHRLPRLQLISLGLPTRGVFEAMETAESLAVVATGGEAEDADVDELFKETFVCEIDY